MLMSDGSWRRIGETASSLEALADEAESLLAELSRQIAEAHDASGAAPGVGRSVSREVAAAAARFRHAAVGVQVLSAELVEAHGVHRSDAARTPRRWLAHHAGLTHRQASELCRAAEARRRYPLLDAAFCEGRITGSHLEAVGGIVPARWRGEDRDRVTEAVAEIQPVLLECAGDLSLEQFIALCERIRDRLDDGPGDRSAEPSRVWLS